MEEEYKPLTITEFWELLQQQDPRFGLIVDLAKPRGSRKNVMPLTRENVRIAFAAFNEKLAEQLTDLAMECFGRAHNPRFVTTEEGEQRIETSEEEIYYQWEPQAALRICNQKLDGFLIEISDRGTVTKFKYERPPLPYPRGWEYKPVMPEVPEDPECSALFDHRSRARHRRKYGNVGDKYDLHGKAWKKS